MELANILITVGVASAVSGVISYSLKAIFKVSIEKRYFVEIEDLKAKLAVRTNTEREVTERRLKAYPKIVELISRIRSMCRDLSTQLSQRNTSIIVEVSSRIEELEETLYEYRFILERDGFFKEVHGFKNKALNFGIKASDMKYFLDHNEERRASFAQGELVKLYEIIENIHTPIIQNLSKDKESAQ